VNVYIETVIKKTDLQGKERKKKKEKEEPSFNLVPFGE